MNTFSFDQMMRDHYPLPGTRLKQYVVDSRREYAWERETAPRIYMKQHADNTGALCRNDGGTPLPFLEHDCCHVCNRMLASVATWPDVAEWLTEKAKRPPVETDREKLSDEIEPDRSFADNPLFAFIKKT